MLTDMIEPDGAQADDDDDCQQDDEDRLHQLDMDADLLGLHVIERRQAQLAEEQHHDADRQRSHHEVEARSGSM